MLTYKDSGRRRPTGEHIALGIERLRAARPAGSAGGSGHRMTDEARACVARARAHLLCAACSTTTLDRQLHEAAATIDARLLVQTLGPGAGAAPGTRGHPVAGHHVPLHSA
jgi:hypothetical protein